MIKNLLVIALICFSIEAGAHSPQYRKDRVQSEKIAFITSELQLTPDEAQQFWPLYNQYAKTIGEARKTSMEALKKLSKATEGENVDQNNIKALLTEYQNAFKAESKAISEVPDYSKVLSASKIAKLYVAEEQFRIKMIWQLGKKDDHRPDANCNEAPDRHHDKSSSKKPTITHGVPAQQTVEIN